MRLRRHKLFRATISELTNQSWFVTSSRLGNAEKLGPLFSSARPAESWTPKKVQKIFDNPRIRQTFIAYDGRYTGDPIGHCSYKVEDDRPYAHWLVVDPRWRGHGIAAKLLYNVATVARKDGYSQLYFYYGDLGDDDEQFCLSSKFKPESLAELDAYRKRLEELYE